MQGAASADNFNSAIIKIVGTTVERLKSSDAILRRVLSYIASKNNLLKMRYIALDVQDITKPLVQVQLALQTMMQKIPAANHKA